MRDDTEFAARHLPLARATSLESWSDLSGAPHLRAGFFARTGHAHLVLGIGGIAVLLGGNGFAFDSGRIAGIVLLFSAAILFAIGYILNRVPLPMPPLVVVAWQVGLGCLAMLILGVVFEQPNYRALTAQGLACFVYMTLALQKA